MHATQTTCFKMYWLGSKDVSAFSSIYETGRRHVNVIKQMQFCMIIRISYMGIFKIKQVFIYTCM